MTAYDGQLLGTGSQCRIDKTTPEGRAPCNGARREDWMERGTTTVKTGHAEMLKGGVIMDVVTADQAKIAEDAGACAVMALERVPADIRAEGGVARMADPRIV